MKKPFVVCRAPLRVQPQIRAHAHNRRLYGSNDQYLDKCRAKSRPRPNKIVASAGVGHFFYIRAIFCTLFVPLRAKTKTILTHYHFMKKIITSLFALCAMTLIAWAADVSLRQLPQPAQEFIGKYFAKDQIKKIRTHHHRSGQSYNVLFTDGSKVNFDSKGQWTKIKLRGDSIPVDIIPEYITTYVWDAYPDVMILSIEQEGTAHEVELSDGTELTFDPKGNVVKID